MSQNRSIPQYKTLNIIKFYTQVYEFVNKYLIFVVAAILSVIIISVLWIREPNPSALIAADMSTWYKAYHQEVGLLNPLNYYAAKELVFDTSSKIYALGWPIWSQNGMINSIDNIVYYNGIVLPRQISKSEWVPHFESETYTEPMITTLLKWMWDSQVNLDDITERLVKPNLTVLEDGLIDTFGLQCTTRNLATYTFCDLKLLNTINSWYHYDLANSFEELPLIHDYIFNQSNNEWLKKSFCESIARQYRYSWESSIRPLLRSCGQELINESEDIAQLKEINHEVETAKITNKIYTNPIMNRYKLMSIYQYLMRQINNNEFMDEQDTNLLTSYNSFITNLGNQDNVIQPYGDIILVFHQIHLIPWLQSRDAFASSSQRELTKQLIATTSLLINGNPTINFDPLSKWSKLGNGGNLSSWLNDIPVVITWDRFDDRDDVMTGITNENTNTNDTGMLLPDPDIIEDTPIADIPLPSLTWLVMSVIWVTPSSITKRWALIIIKFVYSDIRWVAAVSTADAWSTQLYYDSDISGASKITHPSVLFKPINQEKIHGILERYIQNKLVGWDK